MPLVTGVPVLGLIDILRRVSKRIFSYRVRYSVTAPMRVVTAVEFSEWGWTAYRLAKVMVKLDYAIFSDNSLLRSIPYDKKDEGTTWQWTRYFGDRSNSDTWFILEKGEHNIVGWLMFSALTDEAFERAKLGKFNDIEIVKKNIVYLDGAKPGKYRIYFCGLGTSSRSLWGRGGSLLLLKFLEIWQSYEEHGVIFDEVCTVSFTESGSKLCERLQMLHIADHRSGRVYYMKGPALLARTKRILLQSPPNTNSE